LKELKDLSKWCNVYVIALFSMVSNPLFGN
jgi:hypothetical protein